ncbi:branched-chain amino acid ABC transporter permease [Celeribacter naphthalenivorans]|uniref:branched-chain amino acid ABC transporter permease n=1 Tax=Celeribacter naphthalenivorans TaxID=1614694 RepID=UPI001CFC3A48|nr:branched-chain amino acid ABC transporter permease [Celeribacter naphthalenivorans]
METLVQLTLTSLTTGSMYALAAVGLSLIWGALGMLNMGHGAFMTLGAYAAMTAINALGLPPFLGIFVSLIVGAAIGILAHLLVAKWVIVQDGAHTNIMVATAGLAILIEDSILKIYGGYPYPQPFSVTGSVSIGGVAVNLQSVFILLVALVLVGVVAFLLLKTKFGRAIRATAMNRDAARLMGVRTETVFLQVMALAGALAGVSGMLISTQATLSPMMGGAPMLKAFVICVVAGLGNVWGAGVMAIVLAFAEVVVGYSIGLHFGFPAMLLIVILVLIWRPEGLFGKERVVRL